MPDAHDQTKRHAPIMFTTDLALNFDPAHREVSMRFREDPDAFALAFSKAWFKLANRHMDPRARYLGLEVPGDDLNWQHPLPAVDHPLFNA